LPVPYFLPYFLVEHIEDSSQRFRALDEKIFLLDWGGSKMQNIAVNRRDSQRQ
jgi:hypothetical protein